MQKQIILIFAFFNFLSLHAEEWTVPANTPLKTNPLPFEIENIVTGKRVYTKNCQSCHGVKVDGKGKTESPNLIDSKVQAQSDDILFYKIKTGKDDMPGFDDLDENEIWSIINFLRYAKSPEKFSLARNVVLKVNIPKKNKKKIQAYVFEIVGEDTIPQRDVNVNFFIKQEFGRMRFSTDNTVTGADGRVTIDCPKKIIGDAEGILLLYATIEDNLLYNPAKDSIHQKWGIPVVVPAGEEARSLSSSREQTPIWLLVSANALILGVYVFLIKVILNLFKIRKQGKIYLKQ